jgi:hypothetical protein
MHEKDQFFWSRKTTGKKHKGLLIREPTCTVKWMSPRHGVGGRGRRGSRRKPGHEDGGWCVPGEDIFCALIETVCADLAWLRGERRSTVMTECPEVPRNNYSNKSSMIHRSVIFWHTLGKKFSMEAMEHRAMQHSVALRSVVISNRCWRIRYRGSSTVKAYISVVTIYYLCVVSWTYSR